VTLLCRIKKQGGDWVRHYAILDGDVPLELAEAQAQWLGVQEYRRRLEVAGLTPAVGEVLALEQGDTDKLTEYSPANCWTWCFRYSATRTCWTTTSAPATNNAPPSWNWKRSPVRKKHWKCGWKP
jgi:hypothetical protein